MDIKEYFLHLGGIVVVVGTVYATYDSLRDDMREDIKELETKLEKVNGRIEDVEKVQEDILAGQKALTDQLTKFTGGSFRLVDPLGEAIGMERYKGATVEAIIPEKEDDSLPGTRGGG